MYTIRTPRLMMPFNTQDGIEGMGSISVLCSFACFQDTYQSVQYLADFK